MARSRVLGKRFGDRLADAMSSPRAYRLLDRHPEITGTSWAAGGCPVLAAALKAEFPHLKLVGVRDASGVIHHVLVTDGKLFYDADGASTRRRLLSRWRDVEMLESPRVVDLETEKQPGMSCPAGAVHDVRRLLRAIVSNNPSERPGADPGELESLLALLRAALMTYRTGHWSVEGDGSYGNHLLLQRIYEETEKQIDALGERLVGHFGAAAVELETQRGLVDGWVFQLADEPDPMVASLFAAEAIQHQIRRAYESFDPMPPLGIDDMLMTFASEKDEHVYLLRQAVGRQVSVDDRVRRAFRGSNPGSPRVRRLANKLCR